MIEQPGGKKKKAKLVLFRLKQQRGICKPQVCTASSAPELVHETLGAFPHLPVPPPLLPFLGKKIHPCLLGAAVKGVVRAGTIGLLMQTSAGGKHRDSLAKPDLPTLRAEGGESNVPVPCRVSSRSVREDNQYAS